MVDAGANRIGASASVAIMRELGAPGGPMSHDNPSDCSIHGVLPTNSSRRHCRMRFPQECAWGV